MIIQHLCEQNAYAMSGTPKLIILDVEAEDNHSKQCMI